MRILTRLLHRRAATAATALLLGCFSVVVACSDAATAPQSDSLNGAWTSRSSGVTSLLNLTWTRDSVNGTGTYFVIDNALGCGGGSLQGSGTVSFRASRSGATVTGVMTFDNGWTPPYIGTLEDNSRIVGGFRSVDAGSCSYDLFFGLIP
ncbi:MAG TPA: hypothetical protein VF785_02580 [Gemmatimonadaceae bacterium]